MRGKFSDIYTECKDPVYAYLLYMTKNVELAEDLSQETFLKIFLNLRKFKGESTAKTWALTIARNTFLTYARKKSPVLLGEQELESSVFPSEMPEEYLLQREQSVLIQEILMTLNEQDRTVLILRDYEGLSYEEIAGILEIDVGVLKSRIYRARQKFKRLYTQSLDRKEKGGISNDGESENRDYL